MTELEKLLNRLIALGWKPRGQNDRCEIHQGMNINRKLINIRYIYWGLDESRMFSLHDLVSQESGLRQFVCENGLYDITEPKRYDWYINGIMVGTYMSNDWRYRIMMSANFPNKEKFLLDNIKLPDEK